jgi:hypothetical protein
MTSPIEIKDRGTVLVIYSDSEFDGRPVVQIFDRMKLLGSPLFDDLLQQIPDGQLGIIPNLVHSSGDVDASKSEHVIGNILSYHKMIIWGKNEQITYMGHVSLDSFQTILIYQQVDKANTCERQSQEGC